MLVERELAIRAFVPEDYLEVVADFRPRGAATARPTYRGTWFRPTRAGRARAEAHAQRARRLPADGERGRARSSRARAAGRARDRVGRRADAPAAAAAALRPDRAAARTPTASSAAAPQQHARARAGALRATEAAQLPAHRQPPPVAARRGDAAARSCARSPAPYRELLAPGTGERPLGPRFVDDAQGQRPPRDHPDRREPGERAALAPTRRSSTTWSAGGCSRPGTRTTSTPSTTVVTAIASDAPEADRRPLPQPGQRGRDGSAGARSSRRRAARADGRGAAARRASRRGQAAGRGRRRGRAQATRPPRRFTEATLLTAMETAGRDARRPRALRGDARDAASARRRRARRSSRRCSGASTSRATARRSPRPTRASSSIADRPPRREEPGDDRRSGRRELARIERGEGELDAFMRDIEALRARGGEARAHGRGPQRADRRRQPRRRPATRRQLPFAVERERGRARSVADRRPTQLLGLLQRRFGFARFRPYQEEVCRAVARGRGRAARDADRRGQVALLPAPRARARRHDARGLARSSR